MKKIYAVNGSPRKNKNTATMLEKFTEGVSSIGDVEVKLIQLSDYNFKGCMGCHACKMDNDTIYGKCQIKDDIYDLLRELQMADGIVFGSPIFFHNTTAAMRALLERFLYQSLNLQTDNVSSAPKEIYTTCIYTFGMPERMKAQFHEDALFQDNKKSLEMLFKKESNYLCAYNCARLDLSNNYRISKSSFLYQQDGKIADTYCLEAYKAGQNMALKIKEE